MGQSPVQLRMTVPTWIYIAPTQLLIRRLTHSTTLTRIMMQTLNRKGGEPRALRDLQDGRGRGAVAAAGRHPVADRPVAGTACASMREQRDQMRQVTAAKVCLDLAKSARFTVPVLSTAGFDRPLLAFGTICRCPSRSKERSWPRNRGNLVNVG